MSTLTLSKRCQFYKPISRTTEEKVQGKIPNAAKDITLVSRVTNKSTVIKAKQSETLLSLAQLQSDLFSCDLLYSMYSERRVQHFMLAFCEIELDLHTHIFSEPQALLPLERGLK